MYPNPDSLVKYLLSKPIKLSFMMAILLHMVLSTLSFVTMNSPWLLLLFNKQSVAVVFFLVQN